jgi:pimeloyl-ACP methyl ester carboxylesterase
MPQSDEFEPFRLESSDGDVTGVARLGGNADADAPLTVILHGSGGASRAMQRLAGLLELKGDVVLPDLYGYGGTGVAAGADTPAQPNAVEQHVDVVERVLAAHGSANRHTVVIGHSMGAFVGLRAALAGASTIDAVVAIEPIALNTLDQPDDAPARNEDREKVLALAAVVGRGQNRQPGDDIEAALGGFIGYWSQSNWGDLPEPLRNALLAQVEQISAEALACAEDATPNEAYSGLTVPVLLMAGTESTAPARIAVEKLAALLPSVELSWVDGARHMDAVHQPKRFAPDIQAFLDAGRSAPAAG